MPNWSTKSSITNKQTSESFMDNSFKVSSRSTLNCLEAKLLKKCHFRLQLYLKLCQIQLPTQWHEIQMCSLFKDNKQISLWLKMKIEQKPRVRKTTWIETKIQIQIILFFAEPFSLRVVSKGNKDRLKPVLVQKIMEIETINSPKIGF